MENEEKLKEAVELLEEYFRHDGNFVAVSEIMGEAKKRKIPKQCVKIAKYEMGLKSFSKRFDPFGEVEYFWERRDG